MHIWMYGQSLEYMITGMATLPTFYIGSHHQFKLVVVITLLAINKSIFAIKNWLNILQLVQNIELIFCSQKLSQEQKLTW